MDRFINSPNLPCSRASLVLVDGRTDKSIIDDIEKLKISVLKTHKCNSLYEAVSFHPDMFIHHLGGRDIVAAPNAPLTTLDDLKFFGFNIIKGEKAVTGKYPGSAAYNVARMGRFAVCNSSFADKVLLSYLYDLGIKIIDVRQGYGKCSICIIGEGIVVTSDEGIYKALLRYDFEVLKISPGFIGLKGFDYGFIGGASGLISQNTLAFAGDASSHPQFDEIVKFTRKHGIEILMLGSGAFSDIGSIIALKEYL